MAESAFLALAAGGIGMEAMGGLRADQAEAAWQGYNAALARREADITRKRTSYEVAEFRRKGEKFKAEQRVSVAAAGVKMEGTPLSVLAETAGELEKDARMLRYGGRVEAQKYEEQANLYETQAKYAKKAGTLSAIKSLLTGAGTLGLYGYEQGLFDKTKIPKTVTPAKYKSGMIQR